MHLERRRVRLAGWIFRRHPTSPSLNFASSKVRIFPLVTERSSALAAYGDGSPPAAAISATFRRTSSVVNAGRRSYRPSAQRYSIERFLPSIYPLSVSPWRNALTNLLKPGHKLFRAVTRTWVDRKDATQNGAEKP